MPSKTLITIMRVGLVESVDCDQRVRWHDWYHKTSSISSTKSKNLYVSSFVFQLSLPNPLKPGVNSLRPKDAYVCHLTNHHWFRKWLVASMVPSHYLIQCWNIVNLTLRSKLQWNFNWNSNIFIKINALQNVVWEMAAILSRPQCVKLRIKM